MRLLNPLEPRTIGAARLAPTAPLPLTAPRRHNHERDAACRIVYNSAGGSNVIRRCGFISEEC
jgi:hypothetical protein